jgi:hypothetical protein
VPALIRDEAGRGHASLDEDIDAIRNNDQGQPGPKYGRIDVRRDARNRQNCLVLVAMK